MASESKSVSPLRVLIITYYWPPSGGAAVQRWLKLSKYLLRLGAEVHILTVDPKIASYPTVDASLLEEIDPGVTIHTTNSFEPVALYGRLVGKSNIPTAGFANVGKQSFVQRSIHWVRSNLFHPDPRVGWRSFARRKAVRLIRELGISTIITTSPPHSVQLIGRDLKRKFPQLHWIADFRDPWTKIYYYDQLNKANWAKKIDRKMERSVLEAADALVTITEGFKQSFLAQSQQISAEKFTIIPNGYDEADFASPAPEKEAGFVITYTGSIADRYNPYGFLRAVQQVQQLRPESGVRLKFVGILAPKIQAFLEAADITYEHIPPTGHQEAVFHQRSAHLLFLSTPVMPGGDFILPGKSFEYLASGNPIIGAASIGSETELLLQKTGAGASFDREDTTGMVQFMLQCLEGTVAPANPARIAAYSRSAQAKAFWELIQRGASNK